MKRSIYKRLEKVEKHLAARKQHAASRDDAASILKWFDEALCCCGIEPLNGESKMNAFAGFLGISGMELNAQTGKCLSVFKYVFDKAIGYFGIEPLPGESQMDALTRCLGISTVELKGEPVPRLREFRLAISTSIESIGRDALAGRLPESRPRSAES